VCVCVLGGNRELKPSPMVSYVIYWFNSMKGAIPRCKIFILYTHTQFLNTETPKKPKKQHQWTAYFALDTVSIQSSLSLSVRAQKKYALPLGPLLLMQNAPCMCMCVCNRLFNCYWRKMHPACVWVCVRNRSVGQPFYLWVVGKNFQCTRMIIWSSLAGQRMI